MLTGIKKVKADHQTTSFSTNCCVRGENKENVDGDPLAVFQITSFLFPIKPAYGIFRTIMLHSFFFSVLLIGLKKLKDSGTFPHLSSYLPLSAIVT